MNANPERTYGGETYEVAWDGTRDADEACFSLVHGGSSGLHPDNLIWLLRLQQGEAARVAPVDRHGHPLEA